MFFVCLAFYLARHKAPDPLQRLASPLGRVAHLGLSEDSAVPDADAAPSALAARLACAGIGCPQRAHHGHGRREGYDAGGQPRPTRNRSDG